VKVCVSGLWHLGTVTAACLAAAGHDVTGIDPAADVVSKLAAGSAPIFEPGLDELVSTGIASGRLRFDTDLRAAGRAEVAWIAYDTPVDERDQGDVEYVVERIVELLPHLADGTLVLISSQVPVGTTRRIEERSRNRALRFAYSPENLRLGKALDAFRRPGRVVAGVRSDADRETLAALFKPFTDHIEWMGVESAEMTKHALNAFLATSVTFINEIAAICEQVGADAAEVERGLKSDLRIGPRAYLAPGGAIAGGTLARDVVFLNRLGGERRLSTPLIAAIQSSNDQHRQWARNRLIQVLGGVAGKTVAVWGLTYKPGTNTLRRSDSVELCRALHADGARVQAHDPVVTSLPLDLATAVRLCDTPAAAAKGASALVVSTPWPEYRQVSAGDVLSRMDRPVVVDASRFLADTVGRAPGVEYFSVGRGSA
jgi:UDPglucose 6-dehydrogenase